MVAFGSSAPEAVLSIIASASGSGDIALGNVVGSNIANIGLILGITGLMCPIVAKFDTVKFELWAMVGFSVLITLLAIDGEYSRLEGAVLGVLLIGFLYIIYRSTQTEPELEKADVKFEREITGQGSRGRHLLLTILGLGGLISGARIFVIGAVELADILQLPELIIGLVVVAIGTSLPELSISVMAARKKETELITSNIIGSNIFNSLFVIGAAAGIAPLSVPGAMLGFEYLVMLLLSVVLLVTIRLRSSLGWRAAILLLTIYVGYTIVVLV